MKCSLCSDVGTTFIVCVDSNDNAVVICKNCFDVINPISCSLCGKEISYNFVKDSNDSVVKFDNAKITKHGFICQNCFGRGDKDSFIYKSNNLHDYYYKPDAKFKKLTNESENNLYLGVELQVGLASSSSKVSEFCNNHAGSIFYFKRDGSIAGHGCEIVTYPCTLAFHKSANSNWDKLFEDLRVCGFKSGAQANTGIHVHINRSYLTTIQIKKMDLFVNLYKDLFMKLARRGESSYARYSNKTLRSWGHSTYSRYAAINLQNEHTVQFRIFNGSIKKEDLFSSLQLVHALVYFTKEITYSELYDKKDQTIKKFMDFVSENNQLYGNLINLMNRLDLN